MTLREIFDTKLEKSLKGKQILRYAQNDDGGRASFTDRVALAAYVSPSGVILSVVKDLPDLTE